MMRKILKYTRILNIKLSWYRDFERKIFVFISLIPDEFTETCNLFESIEPEGKAD